MNIAYLSHPVFKENIRMTIREQFHESSELQYVECWDLLDKSAILFEFKISKSCNEVKLHNFPIVVLNFCDTVLVSLLHKLF
jgi:hypothetical protein